MNGCGCDGYEGIVEVVVEKGECCINEDVPSCVICGWDSEVVDPENTETCDTNGLLWLNKIGR